MRQKILAVLVLFFVSGVAQAAAPAKYRHLPAKDQAAASRRWLNSNAYAIPYGRSDWSEGAMSSGVAGH